MKKHVCAYTGDPLIDFVVVEPPDQCPLRYKDKLIVEKKIYSTIATNNQNKEK